MRIHPVVLSGGAGTRLWPLSRAMYPKQFVPHLAHGEASLLRATVERLAKNTPFEAPLILCNDAHRFLVRSELEAAGIAPRGIILEPVARNTAPAIAIAALTASKSDPDAIIAVVPSDHVIGEQQAFVTGIKAAARIAAKGHLMLFGIRPTAPATGYGYIKRGEALEGTSDGAKPVTAFHVAAFKEKPDLRTARRYLESAEYFWNSGMFVLHAPTLLDELERLEPEMLAHCRLALRNAREDLGFLRLDEEAFSQCRSVSIDYAVMEKTNTAAMLPLEVSWSDVGSWTALWELSEQDDNGNAVIGDAVLEDTRNCYVHSERGLVATLGVEDLIVVETPDALLVADKARSQDIGRIVARLKEAGRSEHAQHIREHRPWGYFEPLATGPRFQVKLLHVKPGAKLSMQMHHHRSEHWVVVKGTARVTIGDVEKLVGENESVYITATQWHRLENPGKVPLEIIEVQIGSYLGEDDIIRSDDDYNRPEKE